MEKLIVFAAGERLATMTVHGKVHIFQVTDDGALRDVTDLGEWKLKWGYETR